MVNNVPDESSINMVGIVSLSGQVVGTYSIPGSYPLSIAFSPNGAYLATANSESNDVTIFNVGANGNLSGGTSYSVGSGQPQSIAFSPDGKYLATANLGSNDVTVFSIETGGVLGNPTSYQLPNSSTSPVAVAFSPDGNYLATANLFGTAATDGFSSFLPDVTLFALNNGVLSNGISYSLPASTTLPVWPNPILSFTPDSRKLIITTQAYAINNGVLYNGGALSFAGPISSSGNGYFATAGSETLVIYELNGNDFSLVDSSNIPPAAFGFAFAPNNAYVASIYNGILGRYVGPGSITITELTSCNSTISGGCSTGTTSGLSSASNTISGSSSSGSSTCQGLITSVLSYVGSK